MGMFKDLMDKIFRRGDDDENSMPRTGSTPRPAVLNSPAAVKTAVDVEAILNKLAAENDQKLDWKHSIVDLMKLVGMDSSLTERKELAADLHYTGDTNDSATMNMWLHKEVMKKLAANGGKIPADLLAD